MIHSFIKVYDIFYSLFLLFSFLVLGAPKQKITCFPTKLVISEETQKHGVQKSSFLGFNSKKSTTKQRSQNPPQPQPTPRRRNSLCLHPTCLRPPGTSCMRRWKMPRSFPKRNERSSRKPWGQWRNWKNGCNCNVCFGGFGKFLGWIFGPQNSKMARNYGLW